MNTKWHGELFRSIKQDQILVFWDQWTMPHWSESSFMWRVTFLVSSMRQKKHLESVQGKFKPFRQSPGSISYILVGHQKSRFFVSFYVKTLTWMIISTFLLQKVQKFSSSWVAFCINNVGNLLRQFWPNIKKCVLFL